MLLKLFLLIVIGGLACDALQLVYAGSSFSSNTQQPAVMAEGYAALYSHSKAILLALELICCLIMVPSTAVMTYADAWVQHIVGKLVRLATHFLDEECVVFTKTATAYTNTDMMPFMSLRAHLDLLVSMISTVQMADVAVATLVLANNIIH